MKKQDLKYQLKLWELATENLKNAFVKKYFAEDPDCYWVGNEKGGVFYVNDNFFSLTDMVEFIRYNYPVTKMFEYQDYSLKCVEKGKSPINIKNYLKLK